MTDPEVAVEESILSSKVKMKSLVLAAMVAPAAGRTPTIAGAELSAWALVVNVDVYCDGREMLLMF